MSRLASNLGTPASVFQVAGMTDLSYHTCSRSNQAHGTVFLQDLALPVNKELGFIFFPVLPYLYHVVSLWGAVFG